MEDYTDYHSKNL